MAKNSRKRRKVGAGLRIITGVFSVLLVIFGAGLVFQLVMLDMLPTIYIVPISIILGALALLVVILSFKSKNIGSFLLITLMTIVLCFVYGIGNYYVYKTAQAFNEVTNLTTKLSNTISVRTMDGRFSNVKQLRRRKIGVVTSLDPIGTERMLSELDKKGVKYEKVEYTDLYSMAVDLYNDDISAIVFNEAHAGMLQSMDEFVLFSTQTTALHQIKFYTDREIQTDITDDEVDVINEPFTVLISGNDSYGGLEENSRSDMNMLVTVNPKTGYVLMTSIPRDFYVDIVTNSYYGPSGTYDKLTHSGLKGIESTEATIENLLGININYTVRVNFSSVVNLVDSLNGIDVMVDKGLAVDYFYSNWFLKGVKEGKNHLDGERALAFARERHAYKDGDVQRVKNQQIVLEAIIRKVLSPTLIMKYGGFVEALGNAFETDMPASDLQRLVKFEFTKFPKWKFESNTIKGLGDIQFCEALGGTASVLVPDSVSVGIAQAKINAVLNGKSSTIIDEKSVVVEVEENIESVQDEYYDY